MTKILTGQARVDAAQAAYNESNRAVNTSHNKLSSIQINALNTQHKLLNKNWELDEYNIVDGMGVPYPADERAELETEITELTTNLAEMLATHRTLLELDMRLQQTFVSAGEELDRANFEELNIDSRKS